MSVGFGLLGSGFMAHTYAECLAKHVSDGHLVLQSNNEGIAFVTSSPDSPIAKGVRRIADSLAAHLRERSPALVKR